MNKKFIPKKNQVRATNDSISANNLSDATTKLRPRRN